MKKNLVAVVAVLGFCIGQPAQGGIGFGIPLPFPFLVWTLQATAAKDLMAVAAQEVRIVLQQSQRRLLPLIGWLPKRDRLARQRLLSAFLA
jgi:hypothetical protein